ncbi:hypothetical protein [Paenochrobactrum pullorum]|uniref:hypothetical protein n=1 Tax=Paenochrobactrum pullorum TaxID=1324351 RepID=UPI0035BBE5D4
MAYTHSPNQHSLGKHSGAADNRGLTWSSKLTMNGIIAEGVNEREQAIRQINAARPRTARIEREIIWAVVVLYSAIIATFAGLHLYGHFALG